MVQTEQRQGYRDEANFFLKIRAAFPGDPSRTKN